MHGDLKRLLANQNECVAHWQLLQHGWTKDQIRWRVEEAGLRRVEDGVWTAIQGTLSTLQRATAATLTAPDTALGRLDALDHFDIRSHRSPFVVVVRPGTGGPRRHGRVVVTRTARFTPVARRGVLVMPPARALMDSVPHLDEIALRRAVIEALRLRLCTMDDLRRELDVGRRRPAAKRLTPHVEAVSDLPIARTRSNPEGQALVRRKLAGGPPVEVNVKVAGFEADLVDRSTMTITEVDGPAFHADPERDAVRDAAWRAAGFTVLRRPSDEAYDPAALW